MTLKLVSIFTGLGVLDAFLENLYRPSDLLFLFISNNPVMELLRFSLVAFLLLLSFKKKFWHFMSYAVCAGAAIVLSGIGLLGIMDMHFASYVFNVVKPVDFILFLEAGVMMGMCALSYEHADFRMPFRHQLTVLASLVAHELPT
jgi:hypothetical protein